MKRIAIFYASEGTGHRAAAEALRDWFLLDNPDGEVFCADILDFIPSFLRRTISGGYLVMARHAPWVWGWFYKSSDKGAFFSRLFDAFHGLLCKIYLPGIEKIITEFAPEAVFFTHYFGAAPFAKRNAAAFPTFCVDTDFLSHRFQRSREFAATFAASGEAARQRTREGIENVYRTGVPVAPKFRAAPDQAQAREKLGLETEVTTVLLSGGGIGAGAIEEALARLAAKSGWRTVVVCGSNERLYSKLSRRYAANHDVRVEAFVTDMENYYAAADVAVMKPGGLSVSEALTAELPLLLIDPIPGQEELNLRWLVRKGAAVELLSTDKAVSVIKNILDDPARVQEMKQAASRLARPFAARDILQIARSISKGETDVISESAP